MISKPGLRQDQTCDVTSPLPPLDTSTLPDPVDVTNNSAGIARLRAVIDTGRSTTPGSLCRTTDRRGGTRMPSSASSCTGASSRSPRSGTSGTPEHVPGGHARSSSTTSRPTARSQASGTRTSSRVSRWTSFDPDDWAALFRQAGAQFVVPVAEHHDGFAMYDSDRSRWTAPSWGRSRDVFGELADGRRPSLDGPRRIVAPRGALVLHERWRAVRLRRARSRLPRLLRPGAAGGDGAERALPRGLAAAHASRSSTSTGRRSCGSTGGSSSRPSSRTADACRLLLQPRRRVGSRGGHQLQVGRVSRPAAPSTTSSAATMGGIRDRDLAERHLRLPNLVVLDERPRLQDRRRARGRAGGHRRRRTATCC